MSAIDTSKLQHLSKAWTDSGMIRTMPDGLEGLIDLSIARGEFVRALGKHSDAWSVFMDRHRGAATVDGPLIRQWLQEYNLDVLWLREWSVRAAQFVVQVLSDDRVATVDIDTVLIASDVTPHPDLSAILRCLERYEVLLEWQGYEHSPNPVAETRQAFMNRMAQAWRDRTHLIGASAQVRRKTIELHAEWFTLAHVMGRTAVDIAAIPRFTDYDESAILKANRRFGRLIELP